MSNSSEIFNALKQVMDPLDGQDIVSKGMVSGLHIAQDQVQFMIEVDPARGGELEPLRLAAESAVASLASVSKVTAILTAPKKASPPPADPHGMGKNPRLEHLNIKKIIAVASGKGGVGKSTVAVNLAIALSQQGRKVGLLDADIYGPSVPLMTGLKAGKPELQEEMLVPHEAHGLKIMSIGFMMEGAPALIWRGPMVQTAIYQMLRDVAWGSEATPLDVLVIDLPPGTGDAQLTIAQKVPVDGAVIVSTPQDIALMDARKAVEMFQKTNVPILGIVENMSTFRCPNCHHETPIFGHGGAEAEAVKLGIPFLGGIPLTIGIREKSDQGLPVEGDLFQGIAACLSL